MIEFLHDLASEPRNGPPIAKADGRTEGERGKSLWREYINEKLALFEDGFEISDAGEVVRRTDAGLASLLDADIPTSDEKNVKQKIESSIRKFRGRDSTLDDRQDALRDLADVLEFLRPQLKKALSTKDENDLFGIINTFGIRHHNSTQRNNFDKKISTSWLYYFFLSTIHFALERAARKVIHLPLEN